jgi:hypothetical protein
MSKKLVDRKGHAGLSDSAASLGLRACFECGLQHGAPVALNNSNRVIPIAFLKI